MKNISELRNELLDNFKKLKNGDMEVNEVEAMNNTAGKIHQGIVLELKQAELSQAKPNIPFLGYEGQMIENGSEKQLAN